MIELYVCTNPAALVPILSATPAATLRAVSLSSGTHVRRGERTPYLAVAVGLMLHRAAGVRKLAAQLLPGIALAALVADLRASTMMIMTRRVRHCRPCAACPRRLRRRAARRHASPEGEGGRQLQPQRHAEGARFLRDGECGRQVRSGGAATRTQMRIKARARAPGALRAR